MSKINTEPVISWFLAHIIVNGTQVEINGLPKWVHLAILVLTTISAALGARSKVTPTSKVKAVAE